MKCPVKPADMNEMRDAMGVAPGARMSIKNMAKAKPPAPRKKRPKAGQAEATNY